jgi:H+/Cl- antiporter ClcA
MSELLSVFCGYSIFEVGEACFYCILGVTFIIFCAALFIDWIKSIRNSMKNRNLLKKMIQTTLNFLLAAFIIGIFLLALIGVIHGLGWIILKIAGCL